MPQPCQRTANQLNACSGTQPPCYCSMKLPSAHQSSLRQIFCSTAASETEAFCTGTRLQGVDFSAGCLPQPKRLVQPLWSHHELCDHLHELWLHTVRIPLHPPAFPVCLTSSFCGSPVPACSQAREVGHASGRCFPKSEVSPCLACFSAWLPRAIETRDPALQLVFHLPAALLRSIIGTAAPVSARSN